MIGRGAGSLAARSRLGVRIGSSIARASVVVDGSDE